MAETKRLRPPRLTLRQYQSRDMARILDALHEGREVLYSAPTGAGKTTVVTATIVRLSRGDWNGAIVTAPMETVRRGFVDNRAATKGLYDKTIYDRRGRDGSIVSACESWLSKHWQDRSFAAALCWQTFIDVQLPSDLTGWVWFIDEAHNSAAKLTEDERKTRRSLSHRRKEWIARGGRIVVVSATPYRSDGRPVYGDDYVGVRRSIAEHSLPDRDGQRYAPENFEIRACGLEDYSVRTLPEHRGEKAPRHIGPAAVKHLVASWKAIGCPKTIVIVPPGDAESWSASVAKAFTRERVPYRGGSRARVHNAVGTGAKFQRDLVDALEGERGVTHIDESKIDVIVACARFNEGTDWPLCSHVFQVGFPSSIRLTNQRWGRAFRSKAEIEGHPHPNTASITFFVPEMAEELRESMSAQRSERRHMRMALLMAGHLEDHEAGQQLVSVVRDIIKHNTPLAPKTIDLEAVEAKLMPTDEELQDVSVAFRHLPSEDGMLSLASINHVAEHFDLDAKRKCMLWIRVAQHVEETDPELSESLLGMIYAASRKVLGPKEKGDRVPRRPPIARAADLLSEEVIALFDAFVTEKHAGKIRFDPPITERHWYMLSQFTGRSAQQVERSMRQAVGLMFDVPKLEDAFRRYYADHGKVPSLDEDAEPYLGYPIKWRVVNNWMNENPIVKEARA